MDKIDDGGRAFAGTTFQVDGVMLMEGGNLTVRDVFALGALAGLTNSALGEPGKRDCRRMSEVCYMQADAMLVERAKGRVAP
jgi:hypothetical protein